MPTVAGTKATGDLRKQKQKMARKEASSKK